LRDSTDSDFCSRPATDMLARPTDGVFSERGPLALALRCAPADTSRGETCRQFYQGRAREDIAAQHNISSEANEWSYHCNESMRRISKLSFRYGPQVMRIRENRLTARAVVQDRHAVHATTTVELRVAQHPHVLQAESTLISKPVPARDTDCVCLSRRPCSSMSDAPLSLPQRNRTCGSAQLFWCAAVPYFTIRLTSFLPPTTRTHVSCNVLDPLS
jgi:hypothetical protein